MKKYISILTIATLFAGSSFAQTNGSNSVYSRFGFGLLNYRSGAAATTMGGVSLAMSNSKQINPANPASYASVDSLTLLFDVGLTLQNGNFAYKGQKINAKNSSLDYITTSFRLAPNLGLAIGVNPFSTIGYTTENTEIKNDASTGGFTTTNKFTGNGGLHEAFAGIGWAPTRRLSIGVNAGYLWGDMTNTVVINYSDPNINTRRREFHAHPKTYKLDFGTQYLQPLDKNNALSIGAIYGLGHKIDNKASFYDQKLEKNIYIGDTINAHNAFELPHTFGLGLAWLHKNTLRVGFDYRLGLWKNVRAPQLQKNNNYAVKTDMFKNSARYALGAEYVANPYAIRPIKRIRYRIGAAFTSPYTRVNGENGPQHYEVTAGVAIPIINYHGQPTNRSILNLGFSFEQVRPRHAGMIKENYLRFHLGLTFNERWFAKWKAQ